MLRSHERMGFWSTFGGRVRACLLAESRSFTEVASASLPLERSMSDLKSLIRELHRRSVWQVLGIYLMGSWGALQVVDMVVETASLPGA